MQNKIENITYPSIDRMKGGTYSLCVHQFAERGSKGFKAEVEFSGNVFSYSYDKRVSQNDSVEVANVTLLNGKFTIEHLLPVKQDSGNIYGLPTNEFHKVRLACLSPNHWGGNTIGNKHYMFFLENCKTDVPLRSFHSENLLPELAQHRKVLEVLSSTCMINPGGEELSGVGFNATVREELTVRIDNKRIIKLQYGKL